MFRFLTRTDCHISDVAPESRQDDYCAAILGKLQQTYELASLFKCDAILDAGDFFHRKTPTKNSHALTSAIALQHHQYKTPVYSIVGNHDIMFSNTLTLDRQPLNVLYASNTFTHLTDLTLRKGTLSVRLVGIDYQSEPERQFLKLQKGDESVLICVFHGSVAEEPMYVGDAFYSFQSLSSFAPDVWVLGHIHKDQGVRCIDGKHFISLGALSRGSLTYDDMTRTPKISIVTIEDNGAVSIEEHALKVALSTEVFNVEKKERLAKEAQKIDEFIAKLAAISAQDVKGRVDSIIDGMVLEQEVRDTIAHYMEIAEHGTVST